jgi:hypothetical protein
MEEGERQHLLRVMLLEAMELWSKHTNGFLEKMKIEYQSSLTRVAWP